MQITAEHTELNSPVLRNLRQHFGISERVVANGEAIYNDISLIESRKRKCRRVLEIRALRRPSSRSTRRGVEQAPRPGRRSGAPTPTPQGEIIHGIVISRALSTRFFKRRDCTTKGRFMRARRRLRRVRYSRGSPDVRDDDKISRLNCAH